jgi:hypothetical protein
MNTASLQTLAANAKAWARAYVNLTEALINSGVPEEVARAEARNAANFAALFPGDRDCVDTGSGEPCPMCGRLR